MDARSHGGTDGRGGLAPVARGSLTDRVIEQLRQGIAEGTWPLNHRLPIETTLARELGVGRSTVREAVRVLAHAGMLEVRQGDGTFVRSQREIDAALRRRVLAADLLEGYEVRRALVLEGVRLAATRCDDDDVTRLRALLERRRLAYDRSQEEYAEADAAFGEALFAAGGNRLLADLYRGVVGALRGRNTESFSDAELTRDDPDHPELQEMVEAIAAGDPDAAAAAATRRIDKALRVLQLLTLTVSIDRPTHAGP